MKSIYELTIEELHTIAEIVTGYKCVDKWVGEKTVYNDDTIAFSWRYDTDEDYYKKEMLIIIYIRANYDVTMIDISNVSHFLPIQNLVKYVRFIKGIPDWAETADNLNLL